MNLVKILVITKSNRTKSEIVKPLTAAGIDSEMIYFSSFVSQILKPVSSCRFLMDIIKKLKSQEYIILLHGVNGWPILLAIFLGKLLSVQIIYRMRGRHFSESKEIFLYHWKRKSPRCIPTFLECIIEKIATKYISDYILISEWLKPSIPNNKKYEVVRNALDINRFINLNIKRSNKNARTILAVSNFNFQLKVKGLGRFIDNYHSFIKENDIQLNIAGSGFLLDSFKKKYKGLSNITFLGYISKVEDLYASVDIFVHFSYFDAYPTVILEAWASKLPVVANNCCGMKEQIEDGKTGFLVSLDHKDEVERKLLSLATSRETREYFGNNGYWKVKNENNPERMGRELKKAIEKLHLTTN